MHFLPVLNELLFEGYNVPQAAFAIDSLMSFYNNIPDQPRRDGIVLSFNSASTSVIPVLNGRGILSDCKRYQTAPRSFLWRTYVLLQDSMGCNSGV
jgi:actin-related protein 5